MGFKFSYVCDLFTSLENNLTLRASTASRHRNPDVATIANWFSQHGKQIHGGETDRLALLSCLFPERRPERVFGLKEPSLVKIIGRCLLLGISRRQALDSYKICGNGDLGQCVERVMRQAENDNPEDSGVTVEDIDTVLNHIASRCRFSGPDVRRRRTAAGVNEVLGPILRHLTSCEAKWLIRIILKDLSPLTLPARLILQNFHFLLPDLLLLQDSLGAAVALLSRDPMKRFPWRPDPDYAKLLAPSLFLVYLLTLEGIKHCCKMAGKRTMSVERKYDGEYCQIHVDLSKGSGCIQIFSKSGKNSTMDRVGIHSTVKECLRIGKVGCKISRNCILEGELLVWSDVESKILPFHKLRKHVIRSGSFIGTENDSPPHSYEHLYIMLFDVLLIDDQACLPKSYRERRALLKEISHPIDGRAGIAEQEYIDFSLPESQEMLTTAFATAISQRWEGLVLKASDEPYFVIEQQEHSNFGHWIKLKKDYIAGIGDTADFALIGARYDAREAAKLQSIKGVQWTSFFVGCRDTGSKYPYDARPLFRVVDVLNRHNVNIQLLRTLNQSGRFCSCDVDDEDAPFIIKTDQIQLPKVQVLFKTPFVVEMVGSGFEKPAGANYFTLRFPRVLKIHMDRDVEDATTLEELQVLAEAANSVPKDELSQNTAWWAERLDAVDGEPGYIIDTSEHSPISVVSISQPTNLENAPSDTPLRRHLVANEQKVVTSMGKRREIDVSPRDSRKVSRKQPKIARSLSPCIAIHSDHTQTTANTHLSHSQDSVGARHLSNISNLSQPNPIPTYASVGDCEDAVATTSLGNKIECSTTLRKLDEDGLSRSPQPSQQKSAGQNPYQEQQCFAQLELGLAGSSPSVGPLDTLSFLSETPILLGTGVSRDKVDSIPLDPKLLTTSITEFLEKLLDPNFPDKSHFHHSNPDAAQNFSKCSGIVLVESNTTKASQAASDIARIGNALAINQRTGRLPSKRGKLIFLRCEAMLQHGLFERNQAGHPENIRERWESHGKQLFAGSLEWGYGISRQRKRRKFDFKSTDVDCEESSRVGRTKANDSPSPPTMGVDVQLSWDWREVLSLGPVMSDAFMSDM
ncbi:ATP-dependent DNA ligase domain-containing protein [Histoplasma capsulatum H143]|uniref:ATP-dependent DNA ligase domain-containing protein n=1 Tax=Ajellomyces capsulatus (strain H143) TaxID=544712 RepID=C6HFF1_AJECH|nr:ATP-dependent DNA ligase domain-containing protein [Histoplasma capsulatum H143]